MDFNFHILYVGLFFIENRHSSYNNRFFHAIYSNHVFSFPISFQILPRPHPSNSIFSFSLSLEIRQIKNTNKAREAKKHKNHTCTKPNPQKYKIRNYYTSLTRQKMFEQGNVRQKLGKILCIRLVLAVCS